MIEVGRETATAEQGWLAPTADSSQTEPTGRRPHFLYW